MRGRAVVLGDSVGSKRAIEGMSESEAEKPGGSKAREVRVDDNKLAVARCECYPCSGATKRERLKAC